MIKRLLMVIFIAPAILLTFLLYIPVSIVSWVVTGKRFDTIDLLGEQFNDL